MSSDGFRSDYDLGFLFGFVLCLISAENVDIDKHWYVDDTELYV